MYEEHVRVCDVKSCFGLRAQKSAKNSMKMLNLFLLCTIPISSFGFGVENSRVFVSTPVSQFPKRSVEDCMSPVPILLTPNQAVDEAMGYLLDQGETGGVVVSEGKVVGIVTSFDFLQKEAFEGSLLPMEGSAANVEKYVEAAKKICGQTVADIMTPNPMTITAKSSMREAAALMTEHRLQRLPVVSPQKELVGMLTSTDVMRDLRHIIRNLPAFQEASVNDVDIDETAASSPLSP